MHGNQRRQILLDLHSDVSGSHEQRHRNVRFLHRGHDAVETSLPLAGWRRWVPAVFPAMTYRGGRQSLARGAGGEAQRQVTSVEKREAGLQLVSSCSIDHEQQQIYCY